MYVEPLITTVRNYLVMVVVCFFLVWLVLACVDINLVSTSPDAIGDDSDQHAPALIDVEKHTEGETLTGTKKKKP